MALEGAWLNAGSGVTFAASGRGYPLGMAKIKIGEAGGLTVAAVMHAQFTVMPATATVAEVRDYFAASSSRRLAVVAEDNGVYVGVLTPAQLIGGDPARPAADLADPGPTVSPGEPAETGRDLALGTDSRRVPVVDDDGRLVGILAVTSDLQCFCGTTAVASLVPRTRPQ